MFAPGNREELGDFTVSVAGENEKEVASYNGLQDRKVPRLSRVPVLVKITLNSLAIPTGNLAEKSRGTRVHVPRYTAFRYQIITARQPKSSL